MDSGNFEKNEIEKKLLEKLEILYVALYDYANDTLIKLFINTNLTDDIVNDFCIKMSEYDTEFKDLFDTLDKEYNIVTKLINKIKDKENLYLDKLSGIENEECVEYEEVNKKLDIIIDFDSYIYKINNGYVQYEYSKIIEMLNILDQF